MNRLFRMACVVAAALVFSGCAAQAGEDVILAEIRALKEKVSEIDQLKVQVAHLQQQVAAYQAGAAAISEQVMHAERRCSALESQGTVKEIKEALIKYKPGEGMEVGPCGFRIQADATYVVQGTPNANAAPEGTNKSSTDASWSSDIYIEKAFDDWGLALMHLEPGQGNGAESQLSLYSNVNRDSNDTGAVVPVTELWYEQYLFDKQWTITAGKLDPENYLDQNEYAHDECTQFLARIFRSSPSVEWPNNNTIGATTIIAPHILPYLAVNASYFNANDTYEDIFSKPFLSAQLTFKPGMAFGLDQERWDGNLRLYWWSNGLDHPKLVDQGEGTPDDVKNINSGFGLSVDQMVTDAMGVFARVGWERPDLQVVSTNPDAAPVEGAWSTGAQVSGKLWGRDDDTMGLAIGQALPSKHYKDAGNGGAAEGHFEAYYRIKINSNLYMTPDIQCVWNPRGISEPYQGYDNTIFIYGVRGQLDF